MLDFKRIEDDERHSIYEFHAEGDPSRVGRAVVDKLKGTVKPTEDWSIDISWHGSKLLSTLERGLASGNLKDSGTIMWY